MNKEELIEVYKDTKSFFEKHYTPMTCKLSTGTLHNPEYNVQDDSNIIVEPTDTVSALIKYAALGKTAVLNMASSKRKGGGVEKGSVAQEECIFRCSNLFTIPDSYYPIATNELLYTMEASFMRDVKYNWLSSIVKVDVITMPAVNLNKAHIDVIGEDVDPMKDYENTMLLKIQNILDAAAWQKCENIILGAWGCGVFKNDPKVVAELFNKVLERRRYRFKNIVFAVINDNNSVANNFKIFNETIKK